MNTVAQKYCVVCNQVRPFEKPKLNHLLHFVVGLFTASLWWYVWALLAIGHAGTPYRCTFCGTSDREAGTIQARRRAAVGLQKWHDGQLWQWDGERWQRSELPPPPLPAKQIDPVRDAAP